MNDDTLVVLVHGFCCRARNMAFWREHLSAEYPHILAVDMPARNRDFAACLAALSEQVKAARAAQYRQVFFAGHSMGGLLAREYLAEQRPCNARRLVCVATPHAGSKLADIALKIPLAGRFYPPLHALCPASRKTVTQPGLPHLQVGAIVGTYNGHWPGKLFLSDASDGLVESAAAHCPDAVDTAYVTIPHDDMQYAVEIVTLLKRFFAQGHFAGNAVEKNGLQRSVF